jgi:hypothetical protein
MKLIDYTKKHEEPGLMNKVETALEDLMTYGFSGNVDKKAQETVTQLFSRNLDSQYTLLRQIPLAPGKTPVPLILVGPSGVFVIHVSGVEGIFRAREESWLEMHRQTREYRPARRNYLTEALKLNEDVKDFMAQTQPSLPDPSPLLIFGRPGVHIESNQPVVRILRVDAVDRFLSGLQQSQPILDAFEIRNLVEALVVAADDTLRLEAMPEEKKPSRKPKVPQAITDTLYTEPKLPKAVSKIRLSRKQWMLLILMLAVEFIAVIAFLIMIIYIFRP